MLTCIRKKEKTPQPDKTDMGWGSDVATKGEEEAPVPVIGGGCNPEFAASSGKGCSIDIQVSHDLMEGGTAEAAGFGGMRHIPPGAL